MTRMVGPEVKKETTNKIDTTTRWWGVIFWGGTLGNEMVGPFRVPEGVKMNAATYADFLKQNFVSWYRKQP